MKCQALLSKPAPPKKRAVSDYENLVSLINQNMKLWGIRVARMSGVEAWKSPQGTVAPDEFKIPRPEILLRIQDKVFLLFARNLRVFLYFCKC